MKMRFVFSTLLYLCITCVYGVNNTPMFETGGKIYSAPLIDSGMVYVGCVDGKLYAVNSYTGNKVWEYQTYNPVKSEPLIIDNNLFLTSGTSFYKFNKHTGNLLYVYNYDTVSVASAVDFIDQWDYHNSSPFECEGKIYFGDYFGNIHVFDTTVNKASILFTTSEKVPIRTTVNIVDNTLFFGDWNGKIYSVNLNTRTLNWMYTAYTTKPYPSYGGFITQPVIYNQKLYIGARNFYYTVLNITDGSVAWQYHDTNGFWLSSTPVIINDTLYQGGSDSKEIIAFNANTGIKYWTFKTQQNIFCKPAYSNGKLYVVDGDSYNHDSGKGYFYCVDTKKGSLLNSIDIGSNSYSSPVIDKQNIYFGAFNNNLYRFNIDSVITGYSFFNIIKEPANEININEGRRGFVDFIVKNNGTLYDSLLFEFSADTLEAEFFFNESSVLLAVNEEGIFKLNIRRTIAAGSYSVWLSAKSVKSDSVLFNKKCIITVSKATGLITNPVSETSVYPNPVSSICNIAMELNNNSDYNVTLYASNGNKVYEKTFLAPSFGNQLSFSIIDKNISAGIYTVIITADNKFIARHIILVE